MWRWCQRVSGVPPIRTSGNGAYARQREAVGAARRSNRRKGVKKKVQAGGKVEVMVGGSAWARKGKGKR